MKGVMWIVLVIAGTVGGFWAGRQAGEPAAAPVQEEDASADPLAQAKKRIAELEKALDASRRDAAKRGDVAAAAERAVAAAMKKSDGESKTAEMVQVDENGDLLGELEKKLPQEQFAQVTNAFSQMRAQLARRAKGKLDYLASIDVSNMTQHERENHIRFQELLEKREAIAAKMKGGIPDVGAIQEMVKLGIEMEPSAREERSTLMRQMARELGYTGDDVEVIHDTLANIVDCTSSGGLGGIGELGDKIEVGTPAINIKTQVIGL